MKIHISSLIFILTLLIVLSVVNLITVFDVNAEYDLLRIKEKQKHQTIDSLYKEVHRQRIALINMAKANSMNDSSDRNHINPTNKSIGSQRTPLKAKRLPNRFCDLVLNKFVDSDNAKKYSDSLSNLVPPVANYMREYHTEFMVCYDYNIEEAEIDSTTLLNPYISKLEADLKLYYPSTFALWNIDPRIMKIDSAYNVEWIGE